VSARPAEALGHSLKDLDELRAALDEHAIVAFADANGRITFVNDRFCAISGYSRDELLGQDHRINSGHHPSPFMAELWRTIASGKVWRGELCNRAKDGSLYWVQATIVPFLGADGRPRQYVALHNDVSEHKRGEARLRAREEHLELAADVGGVGTLEYDHATRRSYVSTLLRDISPLNYEGRQPMRALLDAVVPADAPAFAAALEHSSDPSGDGLLIQTCRVCHADGSVHWLRVHARTWFEGCGERRVPTRTVGAVTDITSEMAAHAAVLESEERFQLIARSIDEVFIMIDVDDDRILYASPAFARVFGQPLDDLMCNTEAFVAGVHPDDRERVLDEARARLDGKPLDHEYRVVLPQGEVRWIRGRGYPIERDAPRSSRYVIVAEDITDRKKVESALRDAEDFQLRSQKLEALGTMAGGIAHDFNNILAAITGNARMAAGDLPDDHPAQQSLDEIGKAARRARDLVERILTFSRPSETKREALALPPLVDEAIRLVRASLPATIALSKREDPATPAIFADAGQIHQVIVNLVTNASHAIGSATGTIEIVLAPAEFGGERPMVTAGALHAGRYARLSVTDDGCGLSDETRARIFDPFFTTKPVGIGTGLGLSVVHGIIKSCDAGVIVRSEPQLGSTFECYFPAAAESPPVAVAPVPLASASGGSRILYVDDEEPLVFLAERMMKRIGHSCVGCTSPQDALDAFRASPMAFDIVVTDLTMPGMTGFEFARAVLDVRCDMPVVMTSGYARAEDRAEAARIGVRALVNKPNTVDDLCTIIDGIAADLRRGRLAPTARGPEGPGCMLIANA
jgi:PAS domain S-box-containing protein